MHLHSPCIASWQVAALAGLARDLPLERVLPPEFRPLFQSIKNEVCTSCLVQHPAAALHVRLRLRPLLPSPNGKVQTVVK